MRQLLRVCVWALVFGIAQRGLAAEQFPAMHADGGLSLFEAGELHKPIQAQTTLSERAAPSLDSLREHLPLVIIENTPLELLQKCQFSPEDVPETLAEKYIKLAVLVQKQMQEKQKLQGKAAEKDLWNIVYNAYHQASHQLLGISQDLPAIQRPQYYISLAQIGKWTAHALSHLEDDNNLKRAMHLHASASFLKKAGAALKSLPQDVLVGEGMDLWPALVRKGLESLSETPLSPQAVFAFLHAS